jgi:predicted nucleotidyltransferase component of viral defense system
MQLTADMKSLNGLTPDTQSLLHDISEFDFFDDFVFVGGSAISVYLRHRLSEDLDFFSPSATLPTEKILIHIRRAFPGQFVIRYIDEEQIDLKIKTINVTFSANRWKRFGDPESLCGHVRIAPLDVLTAMKINTLFLRAKFRDYYDVYVINKDIFPLPRMFEIFKSYLPEMNKKLFQAALIYTDDIQEDNIKHLQPIYPLNIKNIRTHFEQEIKRWIDSGPSSAM